MSIIKSYNLFLSSSQRIELASSTSAFSLYLNTPLTKQNKASQFRVKLIQACIPFSFSEINSGNNVLSYTYNSLAYTLTVPIGTYTITTLLSQIRESLELAHTITLLFNFNSNTNLATFDFSPITTGNHAIVFSQTTGNAPILRQLGVTNQNLIITMVSSAPTAGTTSNQSVNINPSRNLFLRSDTLQLENGNQEAIVSRSSTTDIIGIIPITVPFSNYITFFDTSSFYSYLNNSTIDYISLYLTDSTSDESLLGLDLNWNVTLVIEEYLLPQSIDVSPLLNTSVGKYVEKTDNTELFKEKESLTDILKKERERLAKQLEQKREDKVKENNDKGGI